jgi:hypothetical protein
VTGRDTRTADVAPVVCGLLAVEEGRGVTFLEPNAGKYRRVLRVYPYMDASDGPNFIFDLQCSPNGYTTDERVPR